MHGSHHMHSRYTLHNAIELFFLVFPLSQQRAMLWHPFDNGRRILFQNPIHHFRLDTMSETLICGFNTSVNTHGCDSHCFDDRFIPIKQCCSIAHPSSTIARQIILLSASTQTCLFKSLALLTHTHVFMCFETYAFHQINDEVPLKLCGSTAITNIVMYY